MHIVHWIFECVVALRGKVRNDDILTMVGISSIEERMQENGL